MEGDSFMLTAKGSERFAQVGVQKVGDEEDKRSSTNGAYQEVTGSREIGLRLDRVGGEHFPYAPENLLGPFGRGEE